jgi:hypothetical protein
MREVHTSRRASLPHGSDHIIQSMNNYTTRDPWIMGQGKGHIFFFVGGLWSSEPVKVRCTTAR